MWWWKTQDSGETGTDGVTEHVQLEIIAAITLIVTTLATLWRAEVAARRAEAANLAAVQANDAAIKAAVAATKMGEQGVVGRAEQTEKLVAIGHAVNGGMAAQKAEIMNLKNEIVRLHGINQDLIEHPSNPEDRLEEIRGQK